MATNVIQVGQKVEIRISVEVAQEKKTGNLARVFKSQVLDVKDNGEIELAMPFNGTRIVLLPLELRYEFLFISEGGMMYKAEGEIRERYKTENRFIIRVRLVTNVEKFQRRQFFRWACSMDVVFWKITEEQLALPNADAIMETLRGTDDFAKKIQARTIDISGGGARFQSDTPLEEGQGLLMCIHLKSEERNEQIMVPGRVLSSEELQTPHHHFYRSRIIFVNMDKEINESIVRFVFAEERKFRKSGKG